MKIAIIGAGISGLGAAYLLHRDHDITVFEKNNYIGGHSRTIDVPVENGRSVPVDTGFIVFNNWNYPYLTALFDHLDVESFKSDMSFGVSIGGGRLEYTSHNMLNQFRNAFDPRYIRMIADIVTFNKAGKAFLQNPQDRDQSLAAFIRSLGLGKWFEQYYLLPMGGAIWSCSVQTMKAFPAYTFLQFFKNHGLLNISERPVWSTVAGGSREYLAKLTASFRDRIKLNSPVHSVTRGKKVTVKTAQWQEEFDAVILASHADETAAMIADKDQEEQQILGNFKFQPNRIVVHKDPSFMPISRKCWSSWVYLSDGAEDKNPAVSLTYWMNSLQKLDTQEQIFVTLNPARMPNPDLTIETHDFSHPIFDGPAIQTQPMIESLQGYKNCYYAGAWQRYGFHEDGIMSGIFAAQKLGAKLPWRS